MYISAAGFSSITTCPLQFLNNFPSLFHLNKIISRLTICYFYIEGIRGARTFEPVTKTPRQTAKITFLKYCTNNKRKEKCWNKNSIYFGWILLPIFTKRKQFKISTNIYSFWEHHSRSQHSASLRLRWVMNFCFV